MRRVFITALAVTAVATAAPALAQTATVNGTTITNGGVGTTISFGGPALTTASADLFLQLTGVSGGNYTFAYTFNNTNPSISNLVNFGFTTTPTLTGISGTGMNFYLDPNNFPGGYTVDACAGPSGNNTCDAANGQADFFSGNFTLTFSGSPSSITLDNFVDRYASLSQIGGVSGEGTPVRGVPEPASWALMLLGFAGVGVAMRRSRKSKPALMQVA